MTSKSKRVRTKERDVSDSAQGAHLYGDLAVLKDIFAPSPKRTVTLMVKESLRRKLMRFSGGPGAFIEEAVACFSGDLVLLWKSAHTFCKDRRESTDTDVPCHHSARVTQHALKRIDEIVSALKEQSVIGASRARVLAGLIEIKRHAVPDSLRCKSE